MNVVLKIFYKKLKKFIVQKNLRKNISQDAKNSMSLFHKFQQILIFHF